VNHTHGGAEPLNVRAVLTAVRQATRAVAAAEQADEALRSIVDSLVPQLGSRAEIFVLGNEGKLRMRTSSSPGEESEVRLLAAGDIPVGAVEEHPAAAAVRSRCPTGVVEGAATPVLWCSESGPGMADADFVSVALPLLRDGEAVGALCLTRGEGLHYVPADLDLLLDVGERTSQMLDNLRLHREVRDARRAKADFLAVMSHELRTPLTAVVGYADLLEAGISGPVNEKQQRHLARIKASAWDLLELIDGILGYARYEGEPPSLNVRKVEPEALLADAVRVVEGTAEEKGLAITTHATGPLPAFPTDLEKARRVLFHLLSNAVKFTSQGEVRVDIRAEPRWIVFTIADTGIGIRPDERSSIFEPFWQGERPETRTTGGAGMGLSLAHKLTELLSGEIEVESEVDRGSTFTVRFPREGPRPALL